MKLIYLICLVLLGAASIIGQRIDQGPRFNQPLNPAPLKILSGLAGIVSLGLLIWGFFAFSWWLPLVGMLAVAIVGGIVAGLILRKGFAPLGGIAMSIIGLVLAGVVLYGSLADA
jgi:hypothetical protein